MALEAYARNLYGVSMFGDLSLVLVKVTPAGIRDAADSSPDTTVSAAGAGVYNVTFPPGQQGWVLGAELVKTSSDGIYPEVLAFAPTLGTIQLELSDEANLSGSEEIHLAILLARN